MGMSLPSFVATPCDALRPVIEVETDDGVGQERRRSMSEAEKLRVLIEACQTVSRMAPNVSPPWPHDLPLRRTAQDAYHLGVFSGLFEAAAQIRPALRAIGIEPVEGTMDWSPPRAD